VVEAVRRRRARRRRSVRAKAYETCDVSKGSGTKPLWCPCISVGMTPKRVHARGEESCFRTVSCGHCSGFLRHCRRRTGHNLQALVLPVGQNTQEAGQSSVAKRFRFTEFLFCRSLASPHPVQRGGSRSSRNAGWAAVDAGGVGAKGIRRAGHTVSECIAQTTGAVPGEARKGEDGLSAYGKIVWSWRPKLAPSLAVMCFARPGGRISDPQGDGGNRARLPGESTA
jgi:hypothetical protein